MNTFTIPTPEAFLATPSEPDEDTEPVTPPSNPLVWIAQSLQTLVDASVQSGLLPEAQTFEGVLVSDDGAELRAINAEAARDDIERQLYEANGLLEEANGKLGAIARIIKPSTSKQANAIREVLSPEPAAPEATDADAPAEEDEPHSFFSEDGVDVCRLCGRHEDDGQGIHVAEGAEAAERALPEGVYVSPTSDAQVTVAVPAPNATAVGLAHPAFEASADEWRTYARALGYGRTGQSFNDVEAMSRSQLFTLVGINPPV